MPTAINTIVKTGFYERLILQLLSKMEQGSLTLVLPNAQMITFGNGIGIQANIVITHQRFFEQCFLYGDIGFGEAYVEGVWETDNICNVIKWFLVNIENAPSVSGSTTHSFFLNVLKGFNRIKHITRRNSLGGSQKNIAEHYDLSNDFFSLFLDNSMTYSSAYFRESSMDLENAQMAKYGRLCDLLELKSTDHVLEIGSGWGCNAIYMAKKYSCRVTTVTISEEQYKLVKTKIEQEELSDRVTVELKDYRNISGIYDKIVSIEMLEAVGAGFYETFFKKCDELLKKNGLLALQVITCPDSRFEKLRKGVDWIQKHIFPGSLLPSLAAINKAVNNTSELTLVDLKDLGLHYARTLHEWHKKFNSNLNEVKKLGFDDPFIRKWNYYLCYCEAAFSMRNIHAMQMLYTRPNNTNR